MAKLKVVNDNTCEDPPPLAVTFVCAQNFLALVIFRCNLLRYASLEIQMSVTQGSKGSKGSKHQQRELVE